MKTTMDIEKDDTHNVYVNMQLTNYKLPSASVPSVITQRRSEYIINNPSLYYVSIIRFQIPAFSVPLFTFSVQDGQSDPNLGSYSVSIEYNGEIQQVFLEYEPRGRAPELPMKGADLVQDYSNHYYFVYQQNHMVDMVNKALLSAFNALSTVPTGQETAEAPYMIFNPETKLFSIIAQQEFYDLNDATITTPIKLWFNNFLLGMFHAFPVQTNTSSPFPTSDGTDYQILIADHRNNWVNPSDVVSSSPPLYLELKENFVDIGTWTAFKRVLITTSFIPIVSELVQEFPKSIDTSSSNSFKSILTDFDMSTQSQGDQRGILEYYPVSQYRLTDMDSTKGFKCINLNILWEDPLGNTYNFVLSPNHTINIKIGFFYKSLYNNGSVKMLKIMNDIVKKLKKIKNKK